MLKSQLQLAPQGCRAIDLIDPAGPHFVRAKEDRQGEVAIFEACGGKGLARLSGVSFMSQ